MKPSNFEMFVTDSLSNNEVKAALSNSAVVCLAAPGNQVVFVSPSFSKHTGYETEEAIGRNLSFLQGPKSEATAIEKFRTLIAEGRPGTVRITNYRKDGTEFVHEVEMRPVRNSADELTHFVAIQRPC